MEVSTEKTLQLLSNTLQHRAYVLAFSHSDYLVSLGGTEKVLHEEQAAFQNQNISYIQVYSLEKGGETRDLPEQLVGINVDSTPIGALSIIQLGLVLKMFQSEQIATVLAIHLHHLMHFSLPGLQFLIKSVCPIRTRYFIHDYFAICMSHNLLSDDKKYCGNDTTQEACATKCRHSGSRQNHLDGVKAFLEAIRPDVIAPSETAARIWSKFFPRYSENVRIVPHQILRPLGVLHQCRKKSDTYGDSDYKPIIAYLGYESSVKGLETWWRICRDVDVRKQYRLYHLGAAGAKKPGVTYVTVSFLKDGPNAMIDAIKYHQVDIAFLWSIWPETYSFTLAEAFAANCFVITTDLSGNIAARVRDTKRGAVFQKEDEMVRFLKNPTLVKDALRENHINHQEHQLEFNPEIAIESAEDLRQIDPGNWPRHFEDIKNNPHLSSWMYLLEVLERRYSQADAPVVSPENDSKYYLIELISKVEALEEKLSVCRLSKLHGLAEDLRIRLGRFPAWSRGLRRIYVVTSHFFSRLFELFRIKKKRNVDIDSQ